MEEGLDANVRYNYIALRKIRAGTSLRSFIVGKLTNDGIIIGVVIIEVKSSSSSINATSRGSAIAGSRSSSTRI